MTTNNLLTRRRALLLGMGATASIGSLALGRSSYKSYQIQSLDDPKREWTAFGSLSLKERAAAKGLIYGAASQYEILYSNPVFAANLVRECKILVAENELKWETLRPTPNKFDFNYGDELAKFAQTNGMLFRGHTLVWYKALPFWFNTTVNRQNAEQFLVNHIQTVVKRYAGKMHSWDVVNEAIEPTDGRADGWRNSPWLELLGTNYIDLAFRTAAKADPKALLVYNDYGLDYDRPEDEAKRTAVLKLLAGLKARGTPIHAFGMQAHLSGSETRFNPKKLQDFLSKVARLGLKIMITELDVTDKDLPRDEAVRDRIVAKAYEDYLKAALQEPAVKAVLTWGLSDRYTWLSDHEPRKDRAPVRPLPYDANLKPKLAWNAIARAFDSAPKR